MSGAGVCLAGGPPASAVAAPWSRRRRAPASVGVLVAAAPDPWRRKSATAYAASAFSRAVRAERSTAGLPLAPPALGCPPPSAGAAAASAVSSNSCDEVWRWLCASVTRADRLSRESSDAGLADRCRAALADAPGALGGPVCGDPELAGTPGKVSVRRLLLPAGAGICPPPFPVTAGEMREAAAAAAAAGGMVAASAEGALVPAMLSPRAGRVASLEEEGDTRVGGRMCEREGPHRRGECTPTPPPTAQ